MYDYLCTTTTNTATTSVATTSCVYQDTLHYTPTDIVLTLFLYIVVVAVAAKFSVSFFH